VLLSHGANVNASTSSEDLKFTPLQYAASRGFTDLVRVLLSFKAHVNFQDIAGARVACVHVWRVYTCGMYTRVTCIHVCSCARMPHSHVAGESPLLAATRRGHIDVASALLAEGADVNLKNNHGHTPLFVAVKLARTALADLLRSHGAVE